MDREKLVGRHPTLYHMADARNWASILRHGLLSASALLDRFGLSGDDREAVEARHRPETVAIPPGGPDPTLGVAYVRDQRPLQPEALAGCLVDVSPEGWLRLLNGRVFFWPTAERLGRMLKGYLTTEQAVFEVDTRRLLDRHGDRVELSHINSGFATAAYPPARRGRSTFVPLADYPYSARNEIAELTVLGAVPDIFEATVRVTGRVRGRADRVVWEP